MGRRSVALAVGLVMFGWGLPKLEGVLEGVRPCSDGEDTRRWWIADSSGTFNVLILLQFFILIYFRRTVESCYTNLIIIDKICLIPIYMDVLRVCRRCGRIGSFFLEGTGTVCVRMRRGACYIGRFRQY
jgi:hypothetical protein